MAKKFSKDPKVKLVSLEEFLEHSDYLAGVKRHCWKEGKKPHRGIYYKVTPQMLIRISYARTYINFGMDSSEKLDEIYVAFRDGKTEYHLFEKRRIQLLVEKNEYGESNKIDEKIEKLEESYQFINDVKFALPSDKKERAFEEYLVDTGYQSSIESLKNNYVVFDVETNGTRKANDDLLSLSIFDPSTGKGYNRYLPLDLQPLVLTGWIHGIKDKDLEKEPHLTQDEVDKVINYFDLKNKILLSFSGGQGTFDSSFIINYCKRHNLVGLETLRYENIKSLFPDAGFGTEGQMSKDNLCRLLKIDGVQEVHSSLNDCLLEWKLFEKVKLEPLLFLNQHMYKYHEGYIVPVSYLNRNPELVKYANISVPNIVGKANCIFDFSLPKKALKEVKKFPTNITGITLENGINSALNAEQQDNALFLAKNKSNLEYIGSLDSQITQIPIELESDGTVKSRDPQYDGYINEVNKVTKTIIACLTPVISFIKENIFSAGKILSQELSISEDGKVLALCDLSNEENVLEIKTFRVSKEDSTVGIPLARQLYYESKGRKTYVLSIDIEGHLNNRGDYITDAVWVRIYQVVLEESEPKPIVKTRKLYLDEISILKMIQDDPYISNISLARAKGYSQNSIGKVIKTLKSLRYIAKEDESKRNSKWVVLRTPDDIITKYSEFNGEITLIFDEKGN